ncbi:tryptophan synthase subunit beta [Candidatus Gottesmanbacteria bacterium]|nr:tryptophan synthase subunit beta [Candidatus Gottesmanbacteria bacterium]
MSKRKGYFGQFGGQFIPELLYPAITELEEAFNTFKNSREFNHELSIMLMEFAGRPTPLYLARNLSQYLECKVYLKREDLLYGGSHKINNALGQVLLAKRMGKRRIITETAAGMHGVATVAAANVLGLKTEVYMGVKDIRRQKINADKIMLMGGKVHPVVRGHGVLKDAVSEALVDYMQNYQTSHYLIGSAVGPHPFPLIVAHFQFVIGKELKEQIVQKEHKLPKTIIACGSGGSNAIGVFGAFIDDTEVELVFVEGGGKSVKGDRHAAAFTEGSTGVFQGTKTYFVQDTYGMDRKTETRSAGLNYPARGPQLAHLYSIGRMNACFATDREVFDTYQKVARLEGLLPAFETCHALAELFKRRGRYHTNDIVVINFSGRGDKDMETALQLLNVET